MEERKDKKFEYSYRAPTEEERREIESIRRFYRGQESKFMHLKKLDARVRNVASGCALSMGVLGCLVFGLGLSMILVWDLTAAGIAVAAAGVVPMLLANPVYNAVLKRNKKKYGDEILRLAEECEKIGKDE